MEIKTLKALIASNSIPGLLVFVTEEPALSKQYIQYISDTLGLPCFYNTAFSDLMLTQSTPHYTDPPVQILVNSEEAIEHYEKLSNLLKYHTILVYDAAYRQAIEKAGIDYTLFNKLDKLTIAGYLCSLLDSQGISISVDSDDLIVTFVERCKIGRAHV